MFNCFFKSNTKKFVREKTFVCKHCKYTCEGCDTRYCYACHSNPGNPCPRCGKTNIQEKELQKKD